MNLLASLLAAYLDLEPGATEVASDYLAEAGEQPLSGDASQARRLEDVISRFLSPNEAHWLTVRIAQDGLLLLADDPEIARQCEAALEQSFAAPSTHAARDALATYPRAREAGVRRILFAVVEEKGLTRADRSGLAVLSIWAACAGCHPFARQVAREISPDAISGQIRLLKDWLSR